MSDYHMNKNVIFRMLESDNEVSEHEGVIIKAIDSCIFQVLVNETIFYVHTRDILKIED